MLLRLLRRNPPLPIASTPPQTLTPTLTPTVTHLPLRSLRTPSPDTPDPSSSSSFTVSYLSSVCGLSPAAAAAAAAAASLRLSSSAGPDSVLALLRGYGFSPSQIASLLSRHPKLLLSRPDRTIRPKLDSLLAFGLPRPDLLALVTTNPMLLGLSLERRLLPNLAFLLALLGSHDRVIAAVRGSERILRYDLAKAMAPNVETLRAHGVPHDKIVLLATLYPRITTQRPDRFADVVEKLRELGIKPTSTTFVIAINAMAGLSRPTWERKLALYRSLGWSDEQTFSAFAKHPNCMLASDEKITKAMDFFGRKLLWEPGFVALWPKLIMLGLEKTIKPRCAVLNLLASKGVLQKRKRRSSLHTVLLMSANMFEQKYVLKYQEEVPEIVEAYQGKVGFPGLKLKQSPRGEAANQEEKSASNLPLIEFFRRV